MAEPYTALVKPEVYGVNILVAIHLHTDPAYGHLVSQGLGSAPVQEDLFDAAGAGHTEALGALEFRFIVGWLRVAGDRGKDYYGGVLSHGGN